MSHEQAETVAKRPFYSPFGRLSPMAQLVGTLLFGTIPLLAISVLFVGLHATPMVLALGGYLVAAMLTIVLLRRGYPHSSLGLGNVTTVFRLTMVAALLAPLAGAALHWAVVGIATLALVLDGVDGALARREGRVSSFGARLDMEVDSVLALILALNVWAAGIAGPLVVLLGLPRYLFIAAARFLPWLNQPLPPSLSRRVICVVQVASLIGLNAPLLPDFLVLPVVVAVAGSLLWSFGRDVFWLWRSRP